MRHNGNSSTLNIWLFGGTWIPLSSIAAINNAEPDHCMESCFCSQQKNGHLTYPLRFSLTLLLNKLVWNVTISVHSGWYPNIQQNHLSKLRFHLISGWEMTASECLCGSLLTWTWAVDESVVDSNKDLFADNLKLLHGYLSECIQDVHSGVV